MLVPVDCLLVPDYEISRHILGYFRLWAPDTRWLHITHVVSIFVTRHTANP